MATRSVSLPRLQIATIPSPSVKSNRSTVTFAPRMLVSKGEAVVNQREESNDLFAFVVSISCGFFDEGVKRRVAQRKFSTGASFPRASVASLRGTVALYGRLPYTFKVRIVCP
jgi:hypothetical protein